MIFSRQHEAKSRVLVDPFVPEGGCQIAAVGMALNIPSEKALFLLSHFKYSIKDPISVYEDVLFALHWRTPKIPKWAKTKHCCARMAVLGYEEHVCVVKNGIVYDPMYDSYKDKRPTVVHIPPIPFKIERVKAP